MNSDPRVLAALQQQLTTELTAADQFSQHALRHDYYDRTALAQTIEAEAVRSTANARSLSVRILNLEGNPNAQNRFPIRIGQDLREMLENDLGLSIEARTTLNNAIGTTVAHNDWGSFQILMGILPAWEEHIVFLRKQITPLGN